MKFLRLGFFRSCLIICGCSPPIMAAATPNTIELDATRSRPLFAPNRRPPSKPVVVLVDPVQPAAVETTPHAEVRGVIFGEKQRIAIVKQPSSPRMIDVTVGSSVDGWTVDQIQRRGIVLRRNNRSVTLSMPEPGH